MKRTLSSKAWLERLAEMQEGYYYPWTSKVAPFNGEDVYLDMVRRYLAPDKVNFLSWPLFVKEGMLYLANRTARYPSTPPAPAMCSPGRWIIWGTCDTLFCVFGARP